MLALLILLLGQGGVAAPPGQPLAGPGGREYTHGAVVRELLDADGRAPCWLFTPAEPAAVGAPVVGFLHGFGASEPDRYGGWIEHLVRRGNAVVFPLYQSGPGALPEPAAFTSTALAGLRAGLAELERSGVGSPESLALLGHGTGGVVAAQLAALAGEAELPPPGAVFAVAPGAGVARRFGTLPEVDLGRIPTGTLLLTLAGDADSVAGQHEAQRIYTEATAVPREDKDFVLLRSDDHGSPPLLAHHLTALALGAPGAGDDTPHREIDALDFFGPWKLFDALCDAAFAGEHREYALGATPEQRFMGHWTDGRPVRELLVRDLE